MKMNSRSGFGIVSKTVFQNPRLSTGAKALYGVLATYAQQGNRECWPSRRTMATDLDANLSSVKRWLRELDEEGVVTREERYVDGRQTTSLLRLLDFVAVYDPDLPEGEGVSRDPLGGVAGDPP